MVLIKSCNHLNRINRILKLSVGFWITKKSEASTLLRVKCNIFCCRQFHSLQRLHFNFRSTWDRKYRADLFHDSIEYRLFAPRFQTTKEITSLNIANFYLQWDKVIETILKFSKLTIFSQIKRYKTNILQSV